MTIAIMDLGTNTFHLMIAQYDEKGLKILYKTKVAIKLGENGISSSYISEKPFRRGVNAMVKFSKTIAGYKPGKIVAIGTAAIRNAKNKNKFLNAIEEESGIQVKVINGMQEANLIYEGVKHAMDFGNHKNLIIDIGGGSVEFIIADQKKIYWKHSFELGAALLLEQFKPENPLTKKQLQQIISYLDHQLQPLFEAAAKFNPGALIGSSGSFDTFAEMIAKNFYKPGILKNKTSYQFNMEDYYYIYYYLLFSTTEERKKMKGLVAMRIDMIVIAAILLTFVLEKLSLTKMYLSTYALKEGVLWKVIKNEMA